MEFLGDFETHFTISGSSQVESMRAAAERLGLKLTHIVLGRGSSVSQPMLTLHGKGGLSRQRAVAAELARQLTELGLSVVRVKIEAAPTNLDVPETESDAANQAPERYFEQHVKLLLEQDTDLGPLITRVAALRAHVSRNVMKVREDGRVERFITQRCHGVGRRTAEKRLAILLDLIGAEAHEILDVEQEFVVLDSNMDLDAGWIEKLERQ